MKRMLFMGVVLLSTVTLWAQQSVIDHYRKLPVSQEYPITKEGDKYFTNSNADYPLEVIVDLRNGFIEIVDDGTGGGTVKLQCVLYRKADRSALIALYREEFDGVGIENSLLFFENEKEWKDMTRTVFPIEDIEKQFGVDTENAVIQYQLPQHGTSITASLFVPEGDSKTIKLYWDKRTVRFYLQNPEKSE